jgi:uncharacterized protein YceK
MRRLLALTMLLAMSGCARHLTDDEKCSSYGFQSGTESYANCRMDQADQHQAQDREVLGIWMLQHPL